jgi:hypothetical protein
MMFFSGGAYLSYVLLGEFTWFMQDSVSILHGLAQLLLWFILDVLISFVPYLIFLTFSYILIKYEMRKQRDRHAKACYKKEQSC